MEYKTAENVGRIYAIEHSNRLENNLPLHILENLKYTKKKEISVVFVVSFL